MYTNIPTVPYAPCQGLKEDHVLPCFYPVLTQITDGFWHYNYNTEKFTCSDSLFSFLGYKEKEHITSILDFEKLIPASERSLFKTALSSHLNDKKSCKCKTKLYHYNKSQCVVTAYIFSFFDTKTKEPIQTFCALYNETDAHNYINALEESEKRFRDALSITGEFMWEIDRKATISYISHKVSDIIGIDENNLTGKSITFLSAPYYKNKFTDFIQEQFLYPHEFKNYELPALDNDGNKKWLLVSGVPLYNADGIFSGYCGMAIDISDRKKQEYELAKAKEHSEHAIQTKARFLSTTGHQIRTPMNAIMGMSKLLQETKLDKEQKTFLNTIQEAGDHLLELISDILDFSRLDSGTVQVTPTSFSLHTEMEEIKTTCLSLLKNKKNVKLNFTIDNHIPDYLEGDTKLIRQVLMHLIQNAIKFTDKGHIEVCAKTIRIDNQELEFNDNNSVMIHFSVADTGPGINEDKIPHLFDEFYQANSSKTLEFSGTGLGLTICKKIVDLMGGSIRVKSTPNLGSTFEFFLPLEQAQSIPTKKHANIYNYVEKDNAPKLNILVAEDSPNNQLLIKLALQKLGHTVTLVGNGQLAVDAVSKQEYDLVLMDIHMPVMDGETAYTKIRTFSDVPIIATTADIVENEENHFLKHGFDAYLEKPINIEKLEKIIQYLGNLPMEMRPEISPTIEAPNSINLINVLDNDLVQELSNTLSPMELRTLYRSFWQVVERDTENLIEAFKRKDWKTQKSIAHKMKGTAACHAAARLSHHCETIENLNMAEIDIVIAEQKFATLLKLLDKTKTEIDDIFDL